MTNVKKVVAPLALVVGLVAAPGLAHARYKNIHFNGNMCESYYPEIKHGPWGVYNTSATLDISVQCPVPVDYEYGSGIPTPYAGSFAVGLYDRNDAPGMDVVCTLKSTAYSNGNQATLGTVTSFTGGPQTPYQIRGTLTNFASIADVALYLDCKLPRTQYGNLSYIQSYMFQYSF